MCKGRKRRGATNKERSPPPHPPPSFQTALLLAATALAFTPLAVACLLASSSVTEVVLRYDEACAPGVDAAARGAALAAAGGAGLWCALPLPPRPRALRAPVHLHYGLTRFHQNHRRYVRSRSDAQLRGDAAASLAPCAPRAAPANGSLPPPLPCGLVAWSAFNDTVRVLVDGREVGVSLPPPARPGGGAAAAARARFAAVTSAGVNMDPATRGGRAPVGLLRDDDALQAWLDPAALPSFRKRVGALAGGSVSLPPDAPAALVLTNAFNSYAYGGAKTIILTDASWLGGRNPVLGWAAAAVAGASGVGAVAVGGVAARRARRLARVADEREGG